MDDADQQSTHEQLSTQRHILINFLILVPIYFTIFILREYFSKNWGILRFSLLQTLTIPAFTMITTSTVLKYLLRRHLSIGSKRGVFIYAIIYGLAIITTLLVFAAPPIYFYYLFLTDPWDLRGIPG